MAKAKKAKKTVSTKKKAVRAPKETALETKKAKKAKKAKRAEKPKRSWVSVLIKNKDISKKGKALIKEADALEVQIADAQDALREKLHAITKELGGATFEHAERGAMTIMTRGEKTFWRAKPAGK